MVLLRVLEAEIEAVAAKGGAIVSAVAEARMPNDPPQLYGDGHAASRIAAALYPSRA